MARSTSFAEFRRLLRIARYCDERALPTPEGIGEFRHRERLDGGPANGTPGVVDARRRHRSGRSGGLAGGADACGRGVLPGAIERQYRYRRRGARRTGLRGSPS